MSLSRGASTLAVSLNSAGPDDPTHGRIPWSVWRLALVIVFGAFMSGLDAAIVNVGLDTLSRDLDASLAETQWVANGYLLALGVSLPATGWLGRSLGVGRLWLGALAAFTASSALCAFAPSIEVLIGLRIVQGLTAGLLIPAGQTILGQAVGPQRLGRVMSILGIAVTAAPAVGPLAGGVILEVAPWPWLFLVNVPIGLVGLALGRRLVPRGEPGRAAPLDRVGLALVSSAIPLVAYAVTRWGEIGRLADVTVLAPLVAGSTLTAAFARHSRRRRHAILDLGLYRSRPYVAASTLVGFGGAALFGASLLLPLYFQVGRGEDALTAGLLLLSSGLGTILVLPLSGLLVDRIGGGLVACIGGAGTVVTTLPFALWGLDLGGPTVQVLLFLRGVTIALAVTPGMAAAYKSVGREQLPDATVQVNILMRIGGALGGSLAAVILASHLDDGADVAFETTFAWLTAASALGLAAAVWLAASERHHGASPAPGPVAADHPGHVTRG